MVALSQELAGPIAEALIKTRGIVSEAVEAMTGTKPNLPNLGGLHAAAYNRQQAEATGRGTPS